jgi:hypothetical protein
VVLEDFEPASGVALGFLGDLSKKLLVLVEVHWLERHFAWLLGVVVA